MCTFAARGAGRTSGSPSISYLPRPTLASRPNQKVLRIRALSKLRPIDASLIEHDLHAKRYVLIEPGITLHIGRKSRTGRKRTAIDGVMHRGPVILREEESEENRCAASASV